MRITYIISLTFRLGFVRLPYPFGVCALLQVCYAAAEKSGGMSTTGAHGSGEESGKADLGKSAGPDLGVRTARRGNLVRNTPPDLGGTSSTSSVAGMYTHSMSAWVRREYIK